MSKKKMLNETKIRWGQLSGVINDKEAKRRLTEARQVQENEFGDDDEFGDDMGADEYGDDMGGDEYGDDEGLADLEGGDEMDVDMDDGFGGDMGGDMGGDQEMAANLITAISDVISDMLGVETDVESDFDDDMDVDMGDDELGGDEFGDDELGGDEFGDDEDLMEELANSINPKGGKVDNAHADHKLKASKKGLPNSINEKQANDLAEAVVRKLAKYVKRK